MRRPSALLFLAAVLWTGPAPEPASAQETTLRVSTIPIIDTAPLHIAIAKGFFKDEQLTVDTTPTTGGAVGLPALAAGAVQIAFSNSVSIAIGASQDLGFKIIAAGAFTGAEPPDLAGIVAKPDSKIATGKDLEGKKLAVNTRANVIWLYANAWVEATGGNPKSVTYLEVPFPQMLDAVAGGQVDAAFVVDPFLSAGLSNGSVKLVDWPYNKVQKNIPIGMYAATEQYIAKNPQVIRSFVKAYNKGVDWANANAGSDEWKTIISGYTKLPVERLEKLKVPPFHKAIDPAKLQPTIDLMKKFGLLRDSLSAKSIVSETALAQ
jgi:NitT/TauT family transport system substrate-binding protein